jgi:vacuolar protein sorting-associated protein VTA1
MDPEVEALGGLASPQSGRQPSVEEIPDEHHQQSPTMARTSSLDQSLHPSRAPSAVAHGTGPSVPPNHPTTTDNAAERFYQQPGGGEISPLAPASHGRASSDGGGYFPRVSQQPSSGPDARSVQSPPAAQSQNLHPEALGSPSAPPPISPIQPSPTNAYPQSHPYYPPQPPVQASSYTATNPISPPAGSRFQSIQPTFFPQPQPQQPSWSTPQPGMHPTNPQAQPPVQAGNYITDDESVAKAQKHARFAISALNFEDVKTAVGELQRALETLGAR